MKTATLSALGIDLPETNINVLMSECPVYGDIKTTKKTLKGINLLKQIIQEYHEDMEECSQERMDSSQKVTKHFGERFRILEHEEFQCLFLTRGLKVIKKETLSTGNGSATIIDNKTIAKKAILCNANSVILMHNHPSGDPTPSQADISATEKAKKALDTFDITITDHIIIGKNTYYSFAEEKIIKF